MSIYLSSTDIATILNVSTTMVYHLRDAKGKAGPKFVTENGKRVAKYILEDVLEYLDSELVESVEKYRNRIKRLSMVLETSGEIDSGTVSVDFDDLLSFADSVIAQIYGKTAQESEGNSDGKPGSAETQEDSEEGPEEAPAVLPAEKP